MKGLNDSHLEQPDKVDNTFLTKEFYEMYLKRNC